jgi:hypothetical protein
MFLEVGTGIDDRDRILSEKIGLGPGKCVRRGIGREKPADPRLEPIDDPGSVSHA